MSTASVTPLEKVVEFISASSAMAEKAAAAEQSQRAMEKEAAEMIPGIVDMLASIKVANKDGSLSPLLAPDEKKACADALKDHAHALSVLTKVAGHLKNAQVDRIGDGGPKPRDKQAGVSPYVGRRSGEETATWQKFRRDIMGG